LVFFIHTELRYTANHTSSSVYISALFHLFFSSVLTVAIPRPEVRYSGKVQPRIVYPSARPDIWIRICHCCLSAPDSWIRKKCRHSASLPVHACLQALAVV